jgi:hypothetical protein
MLAPKVCVDTSATGIKETPEVLAVPAGGVWLKDALITSIVSKTN